MEDEGKSPVSPEQPSVECPLLLRDEIQFDEDEEALDIRDYVISQDFPYIEDVTDLRLKVEDTIFHVNRGILMVASPVFHKMLTTDFKEREEGVVHLPEKTTEEITLFLKCLYPNKHVALTDNIVDTVLPLALEYMVGSLSVRCEKYLEEKYFNQSQPIVPSFDNLLTFVRYGVTCKTGSVQERAIKALAKWKSSSVERHAIYRSLPDEVKARIWKARVDELETACSSVYRDISDYCKEGTPCYARNRKYFIIRPSCHQTSTCTSCNETIRLQEIFSDVKSKADRLNSWNEDLEFEDLFN